MLTDSDSHKKTRERAGNLKKDYESDSIEVKISEKSTFEKDIIKANKDNGTKEILFDAHVRNRQKVGNILGLSILLV